MNHIHQRIPRREDRLQNRTVYIKGELYTLLSRLGSGKFASVWKSTTRDGQYAAVKVFDFNYSRNNINSSQRVRSFRNEIQMARRMHEEMNYVATVYAVDLDRQRRIGFIAMELGNRPFRDKIEDLHQMHFQSPKTGYDYITAKDRKNIWIQLVNILCALYRHDVVHRDIKPANLVFFGSTLKIIDFGIAQDAVAQYNRHQRGGNHPYSAPECFSQYLPITSQADIWSAGSILYYLTYGKTPVYESPRPPSGAPQTKSPLVRNILYYSFQKNPNRRANLPWLVEHPLTKDKYALF
ncbi:unnamed protein product [Adineta ricciae]|uniref:Protein kinase domain-containing protein n=1 Tax=Adineta ricciae TaxID=249248 RepID=A0A815HII9_ADIRI|nr:unnamed protein product [Adineta ricciae]CAF1412997.1 unnamed protein product [Adineta ricciae]